MKRKMIESVRKNLGVGNVDSFREVNKLVEHRRREYEESSQIVRAQMFGELNVSEATLIYKINELLKQVPSLVEVVYNVEVLSERLRVTTMEYFKSVFIDFDSSASNSVSKLVANAIKYVKDQEMSIYREGSSEFVKNIVMKRIEEQGVNGKTYSKSKFIRGLKRNPEKLKQFEEVLTHYIEFQWKMEMMTEGVFSNSLLDELKHVREGEMTLNVEALERLGINA